LKLSIEPFCIGLPGSMKNSLTPCSCAQFSRSRPVNSGPLSTTRISGYAQKDQAESSVLFELIARRYEHRSLAIAANQPFSAWERVFPDKAITVAAIDRLVHHATILEMNTESYRRRAAVRRKADEPATPPTTTTDSLADNHEGND
jgi:hypothetical protein